VEARLLAGESFQQIAGKCASNPEVVEVYHAVFFHVQDRLTAIDYIAAIVIGPRRHAGLTAGDVDVILKVVAYGGGPLVLDAAVRYFRRALLLPLLLDGLDAAALAELRSQLLLKASILALMLPADARNLRKLAALQDALQALAGPGANDALAAGVLQAAAQFEADLAQALAAPPQGASGAAAVVDDAEIGARPRRGAPPDGPALAAPLAPSPGCPHRDRPGVEGASSPCGKEQTPLRQAGSCVRIGSTARGSGASGEG
jgi:hypothetical protein